MLGVTTVTSHNSGVYSMMRPSELHRGNRMKERGLGRTNNTCTKEGERKAILRDVGAEKTQTDAYQMVVTIAPPLKGYTLCFSSVLSEAHHMKGVTYLFSNFCA